MSDDGVWCHLYAEGNASLTLPGGASDCLTRPHATRGTAIFPSHCRKLWATRTSRFFLRIPAWCETGAAMTVNGEPVATPVTPGSYAAVKRTWQAGDTLPLTLPMPVRRLRSHPYAQENAGKVALMRGPILYCVEQVDNAVDNPGFDPRDVVLKDTPITAQYCRGLLNNIVVLHAEATVQPVSEAWRGQLYRGEPIAEPQSRQPVTIHAIPYYAWANRAAGRMQVWLRSE